MAPIRETIVNLSSREPPPVGGGSPDPPPTGGGSRRNRWIVCALCFLLLGAGRPVDDADEPPVANQPPNFNGAVGIFKDFTSHAAPTTLAVGDPPTFPLPIL